MEIMLQAVDRAGAGAAFLAEHEGGLAGECCEDDGAADVGRQVLGQRSFARSGIAEEAENLGRFRISQPSLNGFDRGVLLRTP